MKSQLKILAILIGLLLFISILQTPTLLIYFFSVIAVLFTFSSTNDYINWSDVLVISGVVFAAIQFMEAVKIRRYIFRFGILLTITVATVGASIMLITFSEVVNISKINIPLLDTKSFYQLLSVLSLTILFIFYLLFIKFPVWFIPKFTPKLIKQISSEFIITQDIESLLALGIIIDFRLKNLVEKASKAYRRYSPIDPPNDYFSEKSIDFIDRHMSSKTFVNSIAQRNTPLIIHFLRYAEKYSLWEAGGMSFMMELIPALINNEDSLLIKELQFGGVLGYEKPITNTLFKSLGIISHYNIFEWIDYYSTEISSSSLKTWTKGMEIALKEYFVNQQGYIGNPSRELSSAMKNLAKTGTLLAYKIRKLSLEEIMDSSYGKYGSKLNVISGFFSELENILQQDNPTAEYQPVLSELEKTVQKDTITEGIAIAYFDFLEGFVHLKDSWYARTVIIDPMWIMYGDDKKSLLVFINIRKNIKTLIQERFEENYKDHYSSLIKLMLTVYGIGLKKGSQINNEINKYVYDEFNSQIAKRFFSDEAFRKNHLPEDWEVDNKKKQIAIIRYGQKIRVY